MSVGKSCVLSRIGGGCPDKVKCMQTCRPCYVGIGQVHYYCRHGASPMLYETCVCEMVNGAPCQVPGCPGNTPPAAALGAAYDTNSTEPHFMKYLNIAT